MTDKERIAELEEENERLKDAIEWAEECLSEEASPHRADELRARAFPPKFEEVEKIRYAVIISGKWINSFDTEDQAKNAYDAENVYPVPYKIKRPIATRKKVREEIGRPYQSESVYPKNAKFYMEYEE